MFFFFFLIQFSLLCCTLSNWKDTVTISLQQDDQQLHMLYMYLSLYMITITANEC